MSGTRASGHAHTLGIRAGAALPTFDRPHKEEPTRPFRLPFSRRQHRGLRTDDVKIVRPRLRLRALHLDPAGAPARPSSYEERPESPLTGPGPSGMTAP
jgi:hypothetical protein